MIQFVLHLEPVAKGRPRFNCLTRSAYTPSKTRSYEKDLKLFSRRYVPAEPLRGPIEVEIKFFIPKPRSVKTHYPTKRPDLDNYAKAVLDSMNEIFYKDDSQIVDLRISKRYCSVERPNICITIKEHQE
jgi:Holliday junction resolvase RusA-like endonuclease